MSLWRKSAPCGRGQGPQCKDQYGGQVQCPSGQGGASWGRGPPGDGCSVTQASRRGPVLRVGVSVSGGRRLPRPGLRVTEGGGGPQLWPAPPGAPARPTSPLLSPTPGTHSRSGRCRCRMAQKARPSRKELLRSRMSTPR